MGDPKAAAQGERVPEKAGAEMIPEELSSDSDVEEEDGGKQLAAELGASNPPRVAYVRRRLPSQAPAAVAAAQQVLRRVARARRRPATHGWLAQGSCADRQRTGRELDKDMIGFVQHIDAYSHGGMLARASTSDPIIVTCFAARSS